MNDRIPVLSLPGNAHTEQQRLNHEATERAMGFGHMLRQMTDNITMLTDHACEDVQRLTKADALVVATEKLIIAALDKGLDYGEGTPLEAAILAMVRFTGNPIEYTDESGCLIILDDVEALGSGNA